MSSALMDYVQSAQNLIEATSTQLMGYEDHSFPSGDESWRVDFRTTVAGQGVMNGAWAVNSAQKVTIVDGAYEAFPVAFTYKDKVLMVWTSSTDHYGAGAMRYATSYDGVNFSAPSNIPIPTGPQTDPHGVPGIASLDNRVAFLHMTKVPYAGWLTITGSPGTWPTATPVPWANSSSWTFPCDLKWIDNDTPDGVLLAVSYGGGGVCVSESRNAGVSWQPLSIPCSGTPSAWPYSEATITHMGGDNLLMAVRWESGGQQEIRTLRSSDLGATWDSPVTAVTTASGLPQVTRMPDDTLLMTIRNTANGGTNAPWGYAQSRDAGVTWTKIHIMNEWMMYGVFIIAPSGYARLIGSSQLATADANIWSASVVPA